MWYVLTSKKRKKLLATQSLKACFVFIKKHSDTRVRFMYNDAKTSLVDKRVFIKHYLENTKELSSTFTLCEIMIKGTNNLRDFLRDIGKLEEYETHKINLQKI